jgi:two-component system LytT family response regulator
MIRALIVDDEELARRGLEIRLEKFVDVAVCGQARNGREAIDAVRDEAPDLMFLDVQMPGMDGFEVLRCLSGTAMPAVVFVTAYDEFALKAFESNALDYLLKPINDERLAEAIDRARRSLGSDAAEEHRARLLGLVCRLAGHELTLEAALEQADQPAREFPRRLAIRDGGKTTCVDIGDIDWIDAAGNYLCVHAGGRTHVLRGTMKKFETLLDPDTFVRVHRSTIVNRNRVTSMRPHRNGEYFLDLGAGVELKLSRKYRSSIERLASRP